MPELTCLDRLDIDYRATFAFESSPVPSGHEPTYFKGTVAEVFTGLDPVMNGEPLAESYWFAPRLARAVIENKFSLGAEGHIEALNEVTSFSVELFAGNPNPEKLDAIYQRLGSAGLMDAPLIQMDDDMTPKGSVPRLSYEVAQQVMYATYGETQDILLIPLCHGGFAAGIQSAIYTQRMARADGNSVSVYPVRLSRGKLQDTEPKLTEPERKYLREIGRDKAVFIVDEDCFSGDTVTHAMQGLHDLVPDPRGIVAMDCRDNRTKETQGEHWKHVIPANN